MPIKRSLKAFAAAAALLFALAASAQSFYSNDKGAIRGYDPVAYFVDGKPTRGRDDLTVDYDGATFHFANEANRDRFIDEPLRYTPQFGGYCAWAVSNGYTAPTDPNAWAIVDDRLYLNYSRDIGKRWQREAKQRIKDGERNWPSLQSGLSN